LSGSDELVGNEKGVQVRIGPVWVFAAGPLVCAGFLVCAGALVCGREAEAQAIGQAIMLNQQSMQGVQNAHMPPNPTGGHAGQGGSQGKSNGGYAVADAQRPLPDCGCAKEPVFSVAAGELAAGTKVTLTSADADAAIFYTTDNWTPTDASQRYTGPITIEADTRLQAIVEEPNKLASTIAEADYTVNGPPAIKPVIVVAVGGVLKKGTPLRLIVGTDVSSDTAHVGDRFVLLLDENVIVGDRIAVRKGTPVDATITKVEQAERTGKPGLIAFKVERLIAPGITIPLIANLTLAAPDPAAKAQKIVDASQVHVAGGLPPGEEAEIAPGMPLIATVAADTALQR
jgi:hypothetical protein